MDRIIKICIAIVVIGAIAYFCYSQFSGWYKGNIEKAKIQEKESWQNKTETLVTKITNLEEQITELKAQSIPEEKLAEVFGEQPLALPSDTEEVTLEEIERQSPYFSPTSTIKNMSGPMNSTTALTINTNYRFKNYLRNFPS